jgi:polar amino acid transport system substrate-binding protein
LRAFVAGVLAQVSLAQESAAVKELIPTGKLRVGVVLAPAASAFFVVKDANGQPRGVTVDLANELAEKLGVPVELMVAPRFGVNHRDATRSGAIDVAFMPVDDERKKRVAFGPAYYLIESTYMVTGASGIRTVAEVDRPNVRVVGIANTTTIRAAARSLKSTTISAAPSVDEAVDMLRTGKADAFALSRDSLPPFVASAGDTTRAHALEGGFASPACHRGGTGRTRRLCHGLSRTRSDRAASGARSIARASRTSRWRRWSSTRSKREARQMDDRTPNATDMTPRRGFIRRVASAMALGLAGSRPQTPSALAPMDGPNWPGPLKSPSPAGGRLRDQ